MAKQIDSGTIIPKNNVSNVTVETPLEAKIRIYKKLAVDVVGILILLGGFVLCFYLVAAEKQHSAQAFSVISGMIGAVFGYLYGSRSGG